jgi:hypothetical protein
VIKFQFKGTKVLSNKFNRASTKCEEGLNNIIDEEADKIEKRALANVPYKTGELYRSFFSEPIRGKERGYRIGFRAKHAAFKEFGTGMGLKIDGDYTEFNSYAMNFKTTNYPENYTKQKKYLLSAFILSRRAADKKSFTLIKNLIK